MTEVALDSDSLAIVLEYAYRGIDGSCLNYRAEGCALCEALNIAEAALGSPPSYGERTPACVQCGTAGEFDVPWPCETLRLLAVPYSGTPGYDEAWRIGDDD